MGFYRSAINVPFSVNPALEIRQKATWYWNNIPIGSGKKIALGFTIGVLKGALLTGNAEGALACGVAIAVATSIYALVTPIFKDFLNRTELTIPEALLRKGISMLAGWAVGTLVGYHPSFHKIVIISIMGLLITVIFPEKRNLSISQLVVV